MRNFGAVFVASLVAAVFATALVAAIESLASGATLYRGLAAAGFLGVLALPVGVCLSLAAVGLSRAWDLKNLLAASQRPDEAMPDLAAWLALSIAGVTTLGLATYGAAATVATQTKTSAVIGVATAIAVVLVAIGWLAISRPLHRVLGALFAKLADKNPALLRGRGILGIASLVAVGLSLGIWWVGIRPKVGYVAMGPVVLLGAFLALLVLFGVLWRFRPRTRNALVAAAALVAFVSAATAVHATRSRPETIFSLWGEQAVVGKTVDLIFDIGGLADERSRAAIRPKEISKLHPDILLVTIDTVRADRTPVYGGGAKMPALGKLAKEGVVFDWAFSAGNVTRRSLATISTCLDPHRVRGRVVGWSLKPDPRHILFAERLRAAGYDTAGFSWSEAFFGGDRFGQGIDHREFSRAGAGELVKRAIRFATKRSEGARREEPLFTWVHFIDPHSWKKSKARPPESVAPADRMIWKYDRSLTSIDKSLGRLLTMPTHNPMGRIVIVTSDHGEGLGERGAIYHSTNLYNSQIRIPLVIAGGNLPGRRISIPVGHADLAPTILELAGYDPDRDELCDGRSLVSMMNGATVDADQAFVRSSMVPDRSVPNRSDALIMAGYKYIEPASGEPELYEFSSDPDEKNDLFAARPEVARSMQEKLKELRVEARRSPFPPSN